MCIRDSATAALTPVKLGVGFIPSVQFAPFYVGIEKGFFAEEGIDLQLAHGFENDYLKLVGVDEVQFMVGSGDQVVLGMALTWRARAALFKGLTMGAFGIFVLGRAAWSAAAGTVPEPVTMGAIGALALLANLAVAAMLYAWREGDANMRSVWSRAGPGSSTTVSPCA